MCYEVDTTDNVQTAVEEGDEVMTVGEEEANQTELEPKSYSVPARTFKLTGRNLADVLAAKFPNQYTVVTECIPVRDGAKSVVWIGKTNSSMSYDGRYFDVRKRGLNGFSSEFTFIPTNH